MSENPLDKYGLNEHCNSILKQYRERLPIFEKMKSIVKKALEDSIQQNHIYINALEIRIKAEKSLAGKLELKGAKYTNLSDLTDILGARIITFYTDEVDKIAALVDHVFDIDWQNSIDKRKMHELHSFGYSSLHYICSIPKTLYFDPVHPEINEYRFELQMRTALQHVWSTIDHDMGYKTDVEIPKEYLRNMNRLAGMLELADEQFSLIRVGITDYRRKVQSLVASGKFDEVPLDGDSFSNYMKMNPFDKLNKKIAAINQAEIHDSDMTGYLKVFRFLRFKTLGDVEKMKDQFSDDAYQLAVYQIAGTDLDIINSSVAIQNLVVVYLLSNGAGELALKSMFDVLYGESDYNSKRASRMMITAKQLSFMNK